MSMSPVDDRGPEQSDGAQPQSVPHLPERDVVAMNGHVPRGTSGRVALAPDRRRSQFARLGAVMARYHWLVIALWIVAFVGSVFMAPRFHAALTGPPLDVVGSDSARAQDILSTRFTQPYAEQDLIVFESDDLVATDKSYRDVIAAALGQVQELPGVLDVISPFDSRGQNLISTDGHIATAVVGLGGSNAARQAVVPHLTDAATAAATDQVRVYVTGPSPLIAELVVQEQADLSRAEELGLPVALLILLIASGAVVAAG